MQIKTCKWGENPEAVSNGKYFKNIQVYFRCLGYVVESFVVNANEFDVLQNRKRVIIIGWEKDLNLSIGQLIEQNSLTYKVWTIFEDLPKLHAGEGKDKYYDYADGINDYLHLQKKSELNTFRYFSREEKINSFA